MLAGVAVRVSWRQALAWRMQRHLLDPPGRLPVAEVVRRLCGVQAQVASTAELAVRVRCEAAQPGDVGRALSEGRLVKTWAMRGTLHLLTPEDAGAFLSLIAAGRSWERPSWQRYVGMTAQQMELLRDAVRRALDGASLTREELVAAVNAQPGLGHAGEALRSGWGTLLKPLAWQGDLCHGPSQGGRVTFMRPEAASPRRAGLPEPDAAAPVALLAYLGAHGPATADAFANWLAGGWVGRRRLRAWFGALGDRVAEVEVDGERAYVPAEHVDELASAEPTGAVRLLPGFDQYVLGPGTADGRVVPAGRRAAVSKQSGWISPVVVAGGVVCGTWELAGDRVRVAWFGEAGDPPRGALEADFAARTGIRPTVEIDAGVAARLGGAAAADVVQIAREALANVARHAQAGACRLALRAEGGRAVLEVADDGRGLQPAAEGRGRGLGNVRARAAALGGVVAIGEGLAGRGTRVRVTLPL
jgi:hypothetical protein